MPPTPPTCACRVIIGNQTSHVLEAPRKPPSEMLSKHTFQTCQFYGRLPKECTFQTVILLSVRGNSPHCTAFTSVRSNTKFRKARWKKVLFCDHAKRSTHATTQYATMSTFLSSFAPMTSNDPIKSILVTYKTNAVQQPAIFPALVVTTRLITYLNCPCASRNFHNDFLPGTTALTKTIFSPKTHAQTTQCNTTMKSTAMNNHTLSPKRHCILLRFMNCFCARLDHKRTRHIHIDEPSQKQLSVPKPKRTMQEQNDVSDMLS